MATDAATILIDMQEDVVRGRWWTWWPPSDQVLDRCVELVASSRRAGIPVVYTAVEYKPDGSNTPAALAGGPTSPTEYLVEGTPGTAIVPELKPSSGEVVAVKNLVSAFTAAGMTEALENAGTHTILVAGLAVEGGVAATVADGHARGLRVIVVSDCCAAFGQGSYERHMTEVFPPIAEVLDLKGALAAVGAGAGTQKTV